MADIRIKDLATTASTTASDDFLAVDGTTNGTRKLSAATPSFATSVTVPGVVGPTSTDLTLTGGSTGASLVLGQGTTAANATILPKGTGSIGLATSSATLYGKVAVALATATSPATVNVSGFDGTYVTFGGVTNSGYSTFGIGVTAAGTTGTNLISAAPGNDWLDINYYGLGHKFYSFGAEKSRFTSTGNLLIGTTTDAASLAGGLVVNGSGAGAAASSTTTGALRVTGGVGVSGAGYFGGSLNLNNGGVLFQMDGTTVGGNMAMWFRQASPSGSNYGLIGSASFTGLNAASGGIVALRIANGTVLEVNGGTSVVSTGSGYKVNIADTASASSSTVGALTIGNGTAATNVAIGGGKIWAGSTEASTGSTSGSGIFAGGIYAGAASVFGGALTNRIDQNASTDVYVRNGTTGTAAGSSFVAYDGTYLTQLGLVNAGFTTSGPYVANSSHLSSNAPAGLRLISQAGEMRFYSSNTLALTLAASTQAATFAGAVSIGNTVAVAAAVASTHKVTMVIGGVTYYLLATNV